MKARFEHTSLVVLDVEAAVSFYAQAFSYELVFEERGMGRQIASITGLPGLDCHLAQLRGPAGPVLELIAFSGELPPLPVRPPPAHVAFAAEDLEAALAEVCALGAEPLGAITTFADGRSVYCREPGGSVFELSQSSSP